MTIRELVEEVLATYNPDLNVKIFKGFMAMGGRAAPIIEDFTNEHVTLSDDEQYLLINPPIE